MTSEPSPTSLASWLESDPLGAKRAFDAARCRRSLADFVRLAWPTVEPAYPLVWNWHLDAICLHLEAVTRGEIRKLLINVPPGHGKSLIVSVLWPAWEWTFDPGRRGLFYSYAFDLSIRDSVKCRALISSQWYRETFRPAWSLAGDQNVKSFFQNTTQGFRFAGSVGGAATGFRGNVVVADDPLNRSAAESDTALEECRRWWFESMSSRLNDMRTGAHVIIMQRLAEKDLSGLVLKRGGYDHVCLPSEYEPLRRVTTSIGWADPRTAEGELLFPVLFPAEVLADARKDLGSDGYAGQHQQSPVPADGGKFKRGYFHYYEAAEDPNLLRLRYPDGRTKVVRRDHCRCFATVDLAHSLKQTADWTVFAAWLVTRESDLILVDLDRRRLADPEIVPAMLALAARHPDLEYFAVEINGIGLGVVQTARVAGLTVRGVRVSTDKVTRAQTAAIRMEAGQVFFPAVAPWLSDLEHELLTFPRGGHDDQVDVVSLGALEVFRVGGAEEPEEDREAREAEDRRRRSQEWHDDDNDAFW